MTARLGMWTFLASDAMSFGALLSAWAALRLRAPAGAWPAPAERISLPAAVLFALVLIASSFTVALAAAAARAGRRQAVRGWLVATLALGAAFFAGQAWEWTHLVAATQEPAAALAAAAFLAVTGWHGVHVAAGLVALGAMLARPSSAALPTVALYWQFLDAVWIVLFLAVYGLALPAVALGALAAGGFGGVVWFHMALRKEPRWLRLWFALPLILPLVFAVALVADRAHVGVRP